MPSKLGDVGKLPTSNAMGDIGEAEVDREHTQRLRQHTANTAGQQIYNNPNTAAGMDAQHKWNQNNPIPVRGNVHAHQQNLQNYVDQELVGRGAGPGFAHAQARLQGQQNNNRQNLSTEDQHAEHSRSMADIKREGANRHASGNVRIKEHPGSIDISGDRRRKEKAMGFAPGSMDQGGENYQHSGPRAAALVKQHGNQEGTPSEPVAQPLHPRLLQGLSPAAQNALSPNPIRGEGALRLDGSVNNQMIAPRPAQGSSLGLPGGQQTTAQLQASGQMAPRPPGRYGMTDDAWFASPEGQAEAQAMLKTRNAAEGGEYGTPPSLFESIPKPGTFATPGNIPPAQSTGFQHPQPAPLKKQYPLDLTNPSGPQGGFWDFFNHSRREEYSNKLRQMIEGLQTKPNNTPKPPSPITETIQAANAPVVNEQQWEQQQRRIRFPRLQGPVVNQIRSNMQSRQPMVPVNRPTPIQETIKAANNPIPVVNAPEPAPEPAQVPQQKRGLFPRLRGRR